MKVYATHPIPVLQEETRVPEDAAHILRQLPEETPIPWSLPTYAHEYIGHYKNTHVPPRRVGSHSESRQPQRRPQSGYVTLIKMDGVN